MPDSSPLLLKRLMSITGMLPVGGFLLQHLFSNSYIFISEEAFNAHSEFLTSFPMVVLLELGLIYFPILLHAGLGIAIIYKGKNNFTHYSHFRNWLFFFQRLSGFVALIFITVHSSTTRIASFLGNWKFTAHHMSEKLNDPVWFWFYVIGVLMVTFHFANGLWSFLVTWGMTVGKKAQQMSSALTMGLFVVLSLWAVQILLQF